MTPTPPEGYRIVHNSEIPIVPEGALAKLIHSENDKWDPSTMVGAKPSRACYYAIPIVKEDAKEVEARNSADIKCINEQAAIIDAQARAMKGKNAEIEALKAEIKAMRQHIGIRDDEAAVARHELAELRARNVAGIACINKQAKIIDALLQLIKE